MTLLVIDTQKLLMTEELFNFTQFMQNTWSLIQFARAKNIEVIYIRHDDGEELTDGKEGYEIFKKLAPKPGEKIYTKNVNSVFRDTGLTEYLQSKGETSVMICGLQTDYCIDASVKAAFEHHFEVIVPDGCNSTVRNKFMSAEKLCSYYRDMWNGRYAKCVSLEDALKMMR